MADNLALKTFIGKLRRSRQFAANKAVDFLRQNDTAQIIEDFNRKQLEKGTDSEGNQLGDYGELRTMQRIVAGKQVGFIDLKFTGEFHDNIFSSSKLMSAAKPAIVMGNSDTTKLEDINNDGRFNNAIGLDDKSRDKVGFMVAMEIQKELLKYYMP